MSQRLDTTAIVTERQSDGSDLKRPVLGELILGVRVDELPKGEAERLAAEGKFYPATLDKDGNLRVALPVATRVETVELEVLRDILAVLKEQRDLLQKIA